MNVEYFGKQFEITPAIRDEVESGLGKLTKILGDTFKSKVILTVEKHRNIAEITVHAPPRTPCGTGGSDRHDGRREPGHRAHRDPGAEA